MQGVSPYREHKRYTHTQQVKASSVRSGRYDAYTVGKLQEIPIKQVRSPEQIAEALRQQYPWVNFTFSELGERSEEVLQFAASAGQGIHIVIAPDVLDWMAQGDAAWQEGNAMIGKTIYALMRQSGNGIYNQGAVIGENGEITQWSSVLEDPEQDDTWNEQLAEMRHMLERMQAMNQKRLEDTRKKNEELQKKMKILQKKKLNYQVGRDMARLAKGTTDQDVRALIGRVYANRQKVSKSSGYEKKEVQMAVAEMDHVIRCARKKIRQLKEERRMQKQVERANEKREEERRKELEQELKVYQRNRRAKEHARIFEKLPDLQRLRELEEKKAQALEAIVSGAYAPSVPPMPMPEMSLPQPAAAPPAADTGSVEVTITPMA